MLSILSNRIRLKINKNFMKLLDSSYFYYEYIMGKKIDDTGTVGELIKPLTMMTNFEFDEQILAISLKDFRNPKLQKIVVDDDTANKLIYSLKSKYVLMSYNSNRNMMKNTCENLIWKLDISDEYDAEINSPGSCIMTNFNETAEYITIQCKTPDNMSLWKVTYPKYNPMLNPDKIKTAINEFSYDRISHNIYAKENIDDKYLVGVYADGNVKIYNGDAVCQFKLDNDAIAAEMSKDSVSTFIDENHVCLFTLDKSQFVIINLPYETYDTADWDKIIGLSSIITSYDNSCEFREMISHSSFNNYLDMMQKPDEDDIEEIHTNGNRIFTNREIYMARNELSRVSKSSHFSKGTFYGESYESTVYEKTINYAIMPDGELIINSCTGISDKSVKINDRYYTIIRNINTETNYLAWSDDTKTWSSIIPLPDEIDNIIPELSNDYYIVFSDIGGYTWAYSIDLSKNTIA